LSTPVLHVIAGPNGAGKSSLYRVVIAPVMNLPFVNADEIAQRLWPGDVEAHAYDAAEVAQQTRLAHLENSDSFATETVFSHDSKLDLLVEAADRGYLTTLHIVMIPVELAVARVEIRVSQGGHTVPIDKIRSRFARLWDLLAQGIRLTNDAFVYDNSRAATPFRKVATFREGHLLEAPQWPTWTPEAIRSAGDQK